MDRRIELAIATMESELRGDVSIATLASAAGLSASRFGRLFREATGYTPSAYLRRLRLTRARVLLERTSLSVAEIMTQVGVRDPSHFARDFRREYGVGPRALRQQLRFSTEGSRLLVAWDRSR
jgi:transcriptional regulator GlxA family with amidase domain